VARRELTAESAGELYPRIEEPGARRLLDYLIDHPDQQHDSEALQQTLGFAEHRQVALSAYAIGEIASELGLARPWVEAQRGYTMPEENARLLAAVRQSLAS
jgi:hypothetical protein